MSRTFWLIILFACILIGYFIFFNYKKSYEVLPANLPSSVQAPKFSDWQVFTTNKFSVLLPLIPQNAKETIQNRHYDMYVSEKADGTIFMVSLIEFNQPISDEKRNAILNAIMEDMLASNPENELKSSDITTFENEKAQNFTIENKQISIKGKAFMEGNTLFVLTYITKLHNQTDEEYHFFINSFHLVKDNKSEKS